MSKKTNVKRHSRRTKSGKSTSVRDHKRAQKEKEKAKDKAHKKEIKEREAQKNRELARKESSKTLDEARGVGVDVVKARTGTKEK